MHPQYNILQVNIYKLVTFYLHNAVSAVIATATCPAGWLAGWVAVVVVVVVVVEYLYSASRSASNALIVPQRCEEMCL